jgi:hypothetical protein
LRPNPTFSGANSPVSLVDRRPLLTAPSNKAGREYPIQIGFRESARNAELIVLYTG